MLDRRTMVCPEIKIENRKSTIINQKAFTLIELLVVIAVIALLMAILIPVLHSAREQGYKAVCLSNLKQLTLAWLAYADEHDCELVCGAAMGISTKINQHTGGLNNLESWANIAFLYPESRSALIENPQKGALWPWIKNVDVYRCPRGQQGHALTYSTVVSANGQVLVEGVFSKKTKAGGLQVIGKRVGSTVLLLTSLTDIVSPGASQRAVYIDQGQTPSASDYYVYYLYPKWKWNSPPPIQHGGGTTLSMADGHAEYWKWKGRETIEKPRMLKLCRSNPDVYEERLAGPDGSAEDYTPRTEDGLYDLQRLQRATWGRLGYTLEGEDMP
jgi:prepilin-type N-terminal cleavage/methylation domain-containing protein/prepilin-type processing-associated H-X9-DG protein